MDRHPLNRSSSGPRITLGQVVVSVALAALPLALILRQARGIQSFGGVLMAILLCGVGVYEIELCFWAGLLPMIRSRRRRPSGRSRRAEGITWLEDESEGSRDRSRQPVDASVIVERDPLGGGPLG